jgi:hypothetical protein
MDALAPHAAPSVIDWPIPAPQPPERASQEEIVLPDEVQVDTEPRAQASTQISDHDSILEWAGEHSRHRRRARRTVISITILVAALLALGIVGMLAWLMFFHD